MGSNSLQAYFPSDPFRVCYRDSPLPSLVDAIAITNCQGPAILLDRAPRFKFIAPDIDCVHWGSSGAGRIAAIYAFHQFDDSGVHKS